MKTNKQKEILKPVVGYEMFYRVTNTGKVWSIKRKKFLKPAYDKKGYQYVNLNKNQGHYKSCKIHRIVYQAFRGPIPAGYDVDHLNMKKDDNNIKNLSAIPHSQHVRRHKLGHVVSEETKQKIRATKKKNDMKKKNKNNFYVLVQVDENNYALSGIPKQEIKK